MSGGTEATADTAGQTHAPPRRNTRLRSVSVGVLVVLFAILVPVTFAATWIHRTVLNTDNYVSTIKPIASDPAVTAAASRGITDQIYQALDPQQIVANALPPKAAFLAAPIANGARGYVESAVNDILSSSQFQQLWVGANEFAHKQLVEVLHGNTKVLQQTNGEVVLNLVPLFSAALVNIQGFASNVVGRPVQLPTISSSEPPGAACTKLADALGRPVPQTCGVIVLFKANNLANARRAVQAFDRGVLALLIVTPLLGALALVVSRRRRRTLLQLTIGSMLGLVVVRRAFYWVQSDLIKHAPPGNRDARSAIVHQLLHGFFDISLWLLLGGLVIVLVALATGPYRWAVGLRRRTGELGRITAAAFSDNLAGLHDDPMLVWIRAHFDVLRVSGVVVAVLLLVAFSVNFVTLLVIAALLAAYEVWLHRLRPPESAASVPAQRQPDLDATREPTRKA